MTTIATYDKNYILSTKQDSSEMKSEHRQQKQIVLSTAECQSVK